MWLRQKVKCRGEFHQFNRTVSNIESGEQSDLLLNSSFSFKLNKLNSVSFYLLSFFHMYLPYQPLSLLRGESRAKIC